jgi:DNA-binding CsgD family transcriptional regulator/tetratricopeptide (TPR) repeat protein
MSSVATRRQGGAPILEREVERGLAAELVRKASQGSGATAVVEGPAGVGKTTVLRLFADAADAAGMRTLSARAVPVEQSEAWAGVQRLFDRVVQQADAAELETLLSGAAVNATAPLGLELGGVSVLDPFTCVHGLYWLVANLTNDGPLMIVVDDIQWLDAPSARWLAHMASRSDDLPLVLAVARRTGEPGPAIAVLDELEAPSLIRVRPQLLSERGSEAVITARLSGAISAEIALACHEATGGNPFLLSELCTSIGERGAADLDPGAIAAFGPEGVTQSLRGRLTRLGPNAAAIAAVLSVLGETAEVAAAGEMAGIPIDDAAQAVDALIDAHILESASPLTFSHPVLQAALYESVERNERSRLHREVAARLHEQAAGLERVASHLLRCDPAGDEWVVERLEEAAAAASERGALELAADYLRRALTEPPSGEDGVRLRFRHALARLGQGDRAIADLTRAVLATPDEERPRAALEASRALGLFAEHEAALEICASVPGGGSDPAIASRLSDEAIVNMLTVGPSMWRAPSPAEVLAAAPDPPDEGAEAVRQVSIALVAVKAGRPVAVDRLTEAVHSLVPEFPSMAFVAAGFGLTWCDELATARTMADVGLAYSRSVGSPTGAAQWSSAAAAVCLRQGQIREALGHASASVEFNLDRPPPTLAWPLAPMVECLVLRGELDAASQAADLIPDRTDGFLSTATLTEVVGRLALARGEIQRAIRLLEDTGRRFDSMGFAAPPISAWRSGLAEALVLAGDIDRARELATTQLEIAQRARTVRGIGEAQRVLALCSESKERIAGLTEAAETLRDSPARIEFTRALIDLGAAIARDGHPQEARPPLTEAREIAQECGAAGLEGRALSELVATGARPRRRAVSGLESLTPAELRVADLVASGMSNREAAQALFLSEKTVEGHLGRIFRKLEIGSRTELTAQIRPK